jgi:lipopolysaccharide transport system ATP-binding protein
MERCLLNEKANHDREPSEMSEPLVIVDGVSKKFRRGERDTLRGLVPSVVSRMLEPDRAQSELAEPEFWAVRNLSFTVRPGEALGIIGPNGAGKSTILKLLTRILRPTLGRCATVGRVGALIELAAGFDPNLTGRENVFLQGAVMGMRRAEISSKFDEIVEFAGVGEFIDTPVTRCSSGMNARLGFAIAAHFDPDVLLVDEALSLADAGFQEQCIARMRLLIGRGVPVVFVSHNLPAVVELCTRALVIDQGELTFDGDPASAIREYRQTPSARAAGRPASDIHISSVKLLDASGMPAAVFQTARPITVRIQYRASRPIVKPNFAVDVYRGDGVYCAGINTRMDRRSLGTLEGDGQVDLVVDNTHLVPGCYVLSAGIVDGLGETLDVHHRAYSFSIASDALDLGLAHFDRQRHSQRLETAHETDQPAHAKRARLDKSARAPAAKEEIVH